MFLFLLGVLLSVLIYFKLIKPCSYWTEKGIQHAKAWPIVGSMGKVVLKKKPIVEIAVDVYNKFPNERYVGYTLFTQPILLLRDVDLIKQIGVKDFNHFQDHAFFGQSSDSDPMVSKSLLGLNGDQWRDMRSTLSPAFTSSKMRNMYTLMEECAENFVSHFDGEAEFEVRDIFSKFSNDVIASTAFGIQIDSMKDPKNEFYTMGVTLTTFSLWQIIKLCLCQSSKTITDLLKVQIFPKHVTAFFRAIIKDNIQKREAEGIVRPDLVHLLMQARKGKLSSDVGKTTKKEGFATAEEPEVDPIAKQVELTDDHIVAQAMLFFLAGFDTVSTASCFMAHELAVNPDVQKKLQEEIDAAKRKHGTKIPYEVLLSMKYLDQVVSETLRLWPPTVETDRLCTKDYMIQPIEPEEKGFLVKKGVVVWIPTMALHRDPQYYPEPTRFDPERFNDENKSKVVPGTYLPFGIGPRNCIGSRFALLEIKTLFCHLLSKFDFVPIEKTEIPVKISRKHFTLQPESGFWLGFKPRKESTL